MSLPLLSQFFLIREGDLISGRFKVLKLLGEGAMGAVFLAEDNENGGKQIALKFLKPQLAQDEKQLERFKREIEYSKILDHPYIVSIHDLHSTEDYEHHYNYFSMDYIEGYGLIEYLDINDEETHTAPSDLLVSLLVQLADALSYAHSRGVIHRDIKPANILVAHSGEIRLTDFGIARSVENEKSLTNTGDMLGSPAYISPDYILGYEPSPSMDIYSFGILAYELICDELPFSAENDYELLSMHVSKSVPRMNSRGVRCARWYQDFVDACTSKKAGISKFKNMHEVSYALSRQLRSKPKVHNVTLHERGSFYDVFMQLRLTLRRLKSTISCVLISLLIGALTFYFTFPIQNQHYSAFLGNYVEPFIADQWFYLRGAIQPDNNDVVMVTVSRESHLKLNIPITSVWPRDRTADLLNILAKGKPKAILVNWLYQDRHGQKDEKLAEAIANSGAYLVNSEEFRLVIDENGKQKYTATPLLPNELFRNSAKGLFYGTVSKIHNEPREYTLWEWGNNESTPLVDIVFPGSVPNAMIPEDRSLINYYGPLSTLNKVEAYTLLQDERRPSEKELLRQFKNKIVFIGVETTLPSRMNDKTSDQFPTPYGNYSGLGLKATKALNISNNDYIKRYNPDTEAITTIITSASISFFVLWLSPIYALIVATISFFCWAYLSYSFFLKGIFLPCAVFFIIVLSPLLIFSVMKTQRMRLLASRPRKNRYSN